MHRVFSIAFVLLCCASYSIAAPTDRDTKVRNDKQAVSEAGFWIYDDLDKGIALAKQTGKPLLVVIRCIPCEACEGFDARVVDRDPQISELLEKFVCVRIVKGNGLDLSLFQYDYDLSFVAFLMNADKTIYGRFGTRTKNVDPSSEITMEGFRKALSTALAWHADYPVNKTDFVGKLGPAPRFKVPEEYPSLKPKYGNKLDYEGKVAQSCIHCHQVRDAHRQMLRDEGKPLPADVLYPYPMPDVIGLKLDPRELATVKEVVAESAAEQAGLKPGDKLLTLNDQALLSIADVQWVLHNAAAGSELPIVVERDGAKKKLSLTLNTNWREADDISWRPTTWELRRMATGGMVLEAISAEDRAKLGVPADRLALRVKHVGQYGAHAAAKNAGFQKGDVLVEFDGSSEPLTETQLIAISMNQHRRGEKLPAAVLRGGRRVDLKVPLQ